MKSIDLPIGTQFGRWTVCGPKFKKPGDKHYSVAVSCESGVMRIMKAYNLTGGRAIRCWDCYNKERPTVLSAKQVLVNAVYGHYQKSARTRGYEWDLTKHEVGYLIFDTCFYCGSEPRNTLKDRRKNPVELPKYNGLDRIDNNEGYYFDNIHTCCRWCNEAKKAKTKSEFCEWIEGLAGNSLRTRIWLGDK